MKIVIVSFTRRGEETLRRLVTGLDRLGYETAGYIGGGSDKERNGDVDVSGTGIEILKEQIRQWTDRFFKQGNGLIFVGAAAIAVRMIAPCLAGKDKDPAVVVVDETGRFAIPILSGHLGGANELARNAAAVLNAVLVITTATDLNGTFAVDLFAKENGLVIRNLSLVKSISGTLLNGGEVGFFSEFPIEGECPAGLVIGSRRKWNISITVSATEPERSFFETTLVLAPRVVVLGIGCRRNTQKEALGHAVAAFFEEYGINPQAVACVVSIDLKKDEEGLIALAREMGVPFMTYSAEELSAISGVFQESEFVRSVTGVSNVCERAALCGCTGSGHLLAEKTVFPGVTVAAAIKEKTFKWRTE